MGGNESVRREIDDDRIAEAAMRHFAEHGYKGTRVEDVAHDLGIAKGSVFRHFGTKEELFLAAFRTAVSRLPAWLDAPGEVVSRGTWGVIRYWLERTEEDVQRDWIPHRVALIGRVGTDLDMKRPVSRFMRSEDPYGTLDLIEFGVARGEIRRDVDVEMLASTVDWLAERFQDALVTEELDPGLIHRRPEDPDRRERRIEEFMRILQGAIGATSAAGSADGTSEDTTEDSTDASTAEPAG
jgi:AcrR family transcriptional regulator